MIFIEKQIIMPNKKMKENIEKDIQTLIVTNNYCLLTEIGLLIKDLNKLYGYNVRKKEVIDSLRNIILN